MSEGRQVVGNLNEPSPCFRIEPKLMQVHVLGVIQIQKLTRIVVQERHERRYAVALEYACMMPGRWVACKALSP